MNRSEFENLSTETVRSSNPTVADFDRVARAAIDVYANDDRFQEHVGNRLKRISERTHEDLSQAEFDLPIARVLIADELGFENWVALTDALRSTTERDKPLLFRYAVAAMVRG